jgi:SAM-dependent MidA family methyltransferase
VTDTPLAAKLRLLIEANGPISVADYMAHCLTDPQHGYYMTRDPFGAPGDFVTAPEVSQMFGEIVGAWLLHAWQLCGSPSPCALVELGPGRGTLMADILRTAALVPEFTAAASVHLVETSPVLRARQAETLAPYPVQWHVSFSSVPARPLFLVANEFFDALPVRQYVRAEGVWRERAVGILPDSALGFGIGPGILDGGPIAAEGSILETSPMRESLMAEVGRRIAEQAGAALVIDYGHAASAPGDTLQAVRAHAFADPLAAPGEADLTAHVDFAALSRSAREAGAAVHGPIGQGEFLLKLGLLERAGRLGTAADAAGRQALQEAVERLAGPEQMGSLFKVVAVTQPGTAPPPFAPGI